ncbi:chemotaxis protein CheX [Angustibacter aerolatus]
MTPPLATLELADDVWAVVEAVWESLLHTYPAPAPDAPLTAPVGAVVEIAGAYAGWVRVTCEPGTARRVTEAMLAASPVAIGPLDDEDVEDALRELANVLGGNLKSLLPGDCSLGLPAFLPEADAHTAADPAALTTVVAWPGGTVRLELHVRRAEPGHDAP